MGDIRVAGRMARKSIVRDLAGNILDLRDETKGGWIIRGGRVVDQNAYQELVDKENDKKLAGKAMAEQITVPKEIEDMRAGKVTPPKIDIEQAKKEAIPVTNQELEKRVNEIDSKLDAILNALKK